MKLMILRTPLHSAKLSGSSLMGQTASPSTSCIGAMSERNRSRGAIMLLDSMQGAGDRENQPGFLYHMPQEMCMRIVRLASSRRAGIAGNSTGEMPWARARPR